MVLRFNSLLFFAFYMVQLAHTEKGYLRKLKSGIVIHWDLTFVSVNYCANIIIDRVLCGSVEWLIRMLSGMKISGDNLRIIVQKNDTRILQALSQAGYVASVRNSLADIQLMINAEIFFGYSGMNVDDLVEQERMRLNKSYCSRIKFLSVKIPSVAKPVTWCESRKLVLKSDIRKSNDVVSRNPEVDNSFDVDYYSSVLQSMLKNDMILKKTIVSNSRVLLVAGLEGTGHHALQAMFNPCIIASKKGLHCEYHRNLTSLMFENEGGRSMSGRKGLFFTEDAVNALAHFVAIEREMGALAKRQGDHLTILGLGLFRSSGMFSYPNFNLQFKVLNHPDVFLLAAIAEKVGVDFRVLVLQRQASKILNSVLKRGFGGMGVDGTDDEAKILIDNAASLYAQLRMLDPIFYTCLNYSALPIVEDSEKQRLITFLHPAILAKHFDAMNAMYDPTATSHVKQNLYLIESSRRDKLEHENKHHQQEDDDDDSDDGNDDDAENGAEDGHESSDFRLDKKLDGEKGEKKARRAWKREQKAMQAAKEQAGAAHVAKTSEDFDSSSGGYVERGLLTQSLRSATSVESLQGFAIKGSDWTDTRAVRSRESDGGRSFAMSTNEIQTTSSRFSRSEAGAYEDKATKAALNVNAKVTGRGEVEAILVSQRRLGSTRHNEHEHIPIPAKIEDHPANNYINIFDLDARIALIDGLCNCS